MEEKKYLTLNGIKIIILSFLIISPISLLHALLDLFDYEYFSDFYSLISGIHYFLPFISTVIFIIGLELLYQGKKEFNSKHERSIRISKIILIPTAVLVLFDHWVALGITFIIDVLIRAIGGSLVFLLLIYIIKDLSKNNIKKLLWLMLPIAISTNFFYYSLYYSKYHLHIYFYEENLLGFINNIPIFIVLFCYYHTYFYLREKST